MQVKKCQGAFNLNLLSHNIKCDSLNVICPHTCMDTKGDVTKIPTIDTIVKKINNIFDDTDIVGKRKTNEENYKKMLKRLLNINDSDDIKP